MRDLEGIVVGYTEDTLTEDTDIAVLIKSGH